MIKLICSIQASLSLMKKITIILFLILYSAVTRGEIYNPASIKDIKYMAGEIFDKRNPQKTLFIFPLEDFILRPVHPALKKQDRNYESLFNKAFKGANPSKLNYARNLILLEYPHEVSNPEIIDLIDYIQNNNSTVIVTTPNLTGSVNNVDNFDIWTVDYLKKHKIDLNKGIFAEKKYLFNKEMKKVNGTYPTFYEGLLSYDTDGQNNSAMQAISLLLVGRLKKIPQVVVAVSDSKNYLESLEKQLKILSKDNQFFGVLYQNPEGGDSQISPEEYLKFWQNFVKKLNAVRSKTKDLKSENPYDE